jgi:uncharacterized protein
MTRTFLTRFLLFFVAVAVFTAGTAHAQCVSLTTIGAPLTQPFDALAQAGTNVAWTDNSTIAGWYSTRTTYNAGTGSSNTGALYSFGVAGTNPVTDRALGGVGSGGTGTFYWAGCFTNNTGVPLTSVDIAYVGEQWRDGGAAVPVAQTMAVEYQVAAAGTITDADTPTTGWTAVPALNFTSPTFTNTGTGAALDGNAPANRTARATTIVTGVPVGDQFWIRWRDLNDGGNDHGLAIDEFGITPQGAPPMPTINISDVTLAEGNPPGTTTFTFAVTLTAPAGPGGVTFDIATADGVTNPANAGTDYVTNSLTGQNIPMGSTGPYNFNVTVNRDTDIEPSETFFVNITNVTGATPGDVQGLGTINNDDSPNLTINDVAQLETESGTTTFTFTVSLNQPAGPGGVTFDVATANGPAPTATAGTDYVAAPASGPTGTITQGNTSTTVTITVNGDTDFEPTENFHVNISNIVGATAGDVQGLGTILTDDIGLSIGDVTQNELNAGTSIFTFTVQLTSPAEGPGVTFDIATADGSTNPANAGSDYVAKSETARTIAAGATSATFTVTVNGDTAIEANETFFVNITNVTGAEVTDNQALGTITNDDFPAFTINDVAITEGNAGTSILTFTVTLTPAAAGTVTVDYATADSSATIANLDYLPATGQLTFNPGDLTKTFDVTINGDVNPEGDEQFFANLTNPTGGATISDGQGLGIIKMDDARPIAAVDTPHLENFDTLAQAGTNATTPVGWTFVESGTSANFTYVADTGSNNAGNTYSYGAAANPERAFGGIQSGSVTVLPTIGAFFANNTGQTITRLTINYTGEEWRLGTAGRQDRLDFQYSLDATNLTTGTWIEFDALDFNTPNTVGAGLKDGNNVANRTPLSSTITGLSIPDGATFWLRYNDFNASGSDDGLAVDDFSIVANIAGGITINDVSITEGNAGTQILTFTITRTDPAPVGGTTVDYTTADNTATIANNDYAATSGTATIAQGDTTTTVNVTINGDTNQEPTETFFLNLTNPVNGVLLDNQGVGTINADDFTLTLISFVQDDDNQSDIIGSTVTVAGIVTGIKQGGSGGFFVQEEVADYDSNPNTSEGIFVFTAGAVPAGVVIGNRVAVTGTVAEFPSAAAHTVTELTGTIDVSLLATGQPLPPAAVLTTADGAPTTNISQYERYEGMRVQATLEVTAPTAGSKNEPAATGSSDGVFYGVVLGNPKAFREPGVPAGDIIPCDNPPLATPCPASVPTFDRNPEKIRVDSDNQPGATQLNVVVGQIVSNLVGPLDFGFNEYTILPEAATVPVVTGSSTYIAVPARLATELTVSGFNLERFYDDVPNGAGDALLTTTAYNNRLNKASLAIRDVLRSPDVVGLVEVEHLAAAQALANKINADSGGAVNYVAYVEEGNDPGAIDVGFLVNTMRINNIVVTQIDKTLQYTDTNGTLDELHDRPPLMLNASIQRPDATQYAFTVIVNHLRSLNGNEGSDATGRRVRDKRARQAEHLANLVQSRQTANPNERIILVGDFNAFQFNDGMVDLIGTIKGTPTPATMVVRPSPDLVNPDLVDLIDLIPAADRYTYEFDGNLQVLDHAIVNQAALATHTRTHIGHLDAGFPEIFRTDPNRPERISDHDGVVAYFDISPVGQLQFSAANYDVGEATTTFNVTVNRTGGSAGAVSATYTIAAGTATAGADFTAGNGTVSFAAGETSKTFAVTIANDLIDEPSQTINLSLSAPTGEATLGPQNTATITILDDDAPAVFTISDNSAIEGDAGSTNGQLTVTLTGATEFSTSVNWATAPDSATAGSDYTTSGATLNFGPGAGPQSQIINIPILGDTSDEPNERLFVNLTGAVNATIGDAQGELTIIDNEGQPQLVISDLAVMEGNSGNVTHNLVITLVGSTSQTVTVDYILTGGSATCCGVDFSGPNGTLTFAPGTTTRNVQIGVFGDTIYENNETVLATLTGATNAVITDTQGVLTINNDDAPPVFTIADVPATEGNSGMTFATLIVTKSGLTEVTATVDYATANGTATAGADYVTSAGTLTFAPGTTTQTINVGVAGDTSIEGNETVLVNLTNPANGSIGDPQGILTILDDDGSATLAISDVTLDEGNAGTTNFVFNVTLAGTTSQTVTVNYTTLDSSANAGSDYTLTAGTLTFAPGTLVQQITVPVAGDTTVENNETFFVNLSGATNATVADAQGLGTINNDDSFGVADLRITQSISPPNPRGGQPLTITVTVTNFGPADATNVVLTDNTPPGMNLTSVTPSQGTCSGNPTVVCQLGTILNGGSATVSIVLTPPANGGAFSNTASVVSNQSDPTPVVGNSQPIVVEAADSHHAIPTLSEWALIALALMLAALAATRLRLT